MSRPTNVTVAGCNFTGNVATDRGGAVNLQAGALVISDSTFVSNRATAATLTDVGTGGGLAIIDSCSNTPCPAASARLTNTSFSSNFAFQAGGGLYFSGSNPGVFLTEVEMSVSMSRGSPSFFAFQIAEAKGPISA